MFNKKDEYDVRDSDIETIIGPSVKVEGDFVGHGNLIIEGVVKGNVRTDGNLTVGEKSHITASISATNAVISGEIIGDVTIENDLELTGTAKVHGDITAKSFVVARGALFNGRCDMRGGHPEPIKQSGDVAALGESDNKETSL